MTDERNLLEDKIIRGAALCFFYREKSYKEKLLVIDFDRALAALISSDSEKDVVIEKVSKGGSVSFMSDLEKLLLKKQIDPAEMTGSIWHVINRKMERFHRFPERQKDLEAVEFSSGKVLTCSELDAVFENGSKEPLSRAISEGIRMWLDTGSDETVIRILPVGKTVIYQPAVFLIYHSLGSEPGLEDPRIILTENMNQDIPAQGAKMLAEMQKKKNPVFDSDIFLLLVDRSGNEFPLNIAHKGMRVPEKESFSSAFFITESSKLTIILDGNKRNILLSGPEMPKEGEAVQAAFRQSDDGKIQIIIKNLPQDGGKEIRLTAELQD